MVENIVAYLIETFAFINSKESLIFFISLMPILELRGGILAGYLLGVDLTTTFIVSFIGNILPIPFILFFIEKIFCLFKKFHIFENIIVKLENRALSRSENIQKYEFIGLLLFVGIPLPGTGAWTGALIAALLKLNKKKAFVTIALGVLLAGIIMSLASFGLLNFIGL